jgi:hypothetical protein
MILAVLLNIDGIDKNSVPVVELENTVGLKY